MKATKAELTSALRALRLEALHYRNTGRGGAFLDAAIQRASKVLAETPHGLLGTRVDEEARKVMRAGTGRLRNVPDFPEGACSPIDANPDVAWPERKPS